MHEYFIKTMLRTIICWLNTLKSRGKTCNLCCSDGLPFTFMFYDVLDDQVWHVRKTSSRGSRLLVLTCSQWDCIPTSVWKHHRRAARKPVAFYIGLGTVRPPPRAPCYDSVHKYLSNFQHMHRQHLSHYHTKLTTYGYINLRIGTAHHSLALTEFVITLRDKLSRAPFCYIYCYCLANKQINIHIVLR